MNRPVIFRGLNYLGQWRFGYYTVVKRLSRLEPTIYECMNPEEDERQSQWSVKEETVGMGTGMRDSKGREIFEGDVIKALTAKTIDELSSRGIVAIDQFEVIFDRGCFWLFNKNFHTTNQMYSWPEHCFPMFRVDHSLYSEVIGNIHENPDLRDKVRNAPLPEIKSYGL